MKELIKLNGVDLEVLEYRDTWSLSDRQVAQAYGVTQEAVRKQRTQGATEYVEGVHFYYKNMFNDGKGGLTDTPDRSGGGAQIPQKMVFWTKKGVITLGFKLTETPQTIIFRDWASDFMLRKYQTPQTFSQALYLAAEQAQQIETLQQKARADAPYVSFAKSVEASVDSILIGNYAKLLSDSEGVAIGQNRLFDFLRASGYLISGGARHNVPMQRYIDRGYFEVTTQTFAGSTGTHQKFTTKITGKGQIALAGKIVEYFKGERI